MTIWAKFKVFMKRVRLRWAAGDELAKRKKGFDSYA